MSNRILTAAAVALAVAASPASASTIVYSNLDVGGTYACCVGWAIDGESTFPGLGLDAASPFVPTQTFTLDSIDVAFTYRFGTNAVELLLMSDIGGLPGVVIESFSLTGLPQFGSGDNLLTTATSVVQPLLMGGEQYWVVGSASGETSAAFNWNTTGDLGMAFRTSKVGAWVGQSEEAAGAFRVNGTAVVPEPTTFMLLGTALVGMGARRWRQRKAS